MTMICGIKCKSVEDASRLFAELGKWFKTRIDQGGQFVELHTAWDTRYEDAVRSSVQLEVNKVCLDPDVEYTFKYE